MNIYYTMDDSTPPTSSTKYTSAFTVTSGKTVKAVAEDADGATSSVVSKTYDSGGGGTWVNNTYIWGKGGIASIGSSSGSSNATMSIIGTLPKADAIVKIKAANG
jgi:hypothetical protein